jgi:hypothetical protein
VCSRTTVGEFAFLGLFMPVVAFVFWAAILKLKSYLFALTVTERRFLPLALLLFIIALPPRVDILFRNPCTLFLFLLLG